MSRIGKLFVAATSVAVIGLSAASPATADAIKDFYRGKTIRLVFGFSAGGTYGKYSFLLAEFMEKYIPGRPTVVAQSMSGAGGLRASNYAYNIMPKDGSALFMPPDSLVIAQLLNPKVAKYKANEFTWLGAAIQSNSIIVVRRDAGIKSYKDLRTKQIIMASTGRGSQTFLVPRLINAVLGARFKVVQGYKGSRGSLYAMERNEAQGVSLTWLAFKTGRPFWFEEGGLGQPVLQLGFKREKDLHNVPMVREVVKNPNHLKIVNFMASMGPIGRGLAVPPGVPKERVAALRQAFNQALADPNFLDKAQKRNLRVDPAVGEEIQAIVNQALDVSPAIVAEAREMIIGSGS